MDRAPQLLTVDLVKDVVDLQSGVTGDTLLEGDQSDPVSSQLEQNTERMDGSWLVTGDSDECAASRRRLVLARVPDGKGPGESQSCSA